MKKDKIKFVSEEQERIFNFLLKIAQNIRPELYKQFENEAKAVLELPSIRAEYGKVETFKSTYISTPTNFQAKAEFWLQTVYLKLEPEKIQMLFKLANLMKAKQEKGETVTPFEFLISAMNVEPNPTQYVRNIRKEKEEKVYKSIDFNF